jgi:hypothetical protein
MRVRGKTASEGGVVRVASLVRHHISTRRRDANTAGTSSGQTVRADASAKRLGTRAK